MLDDVHLLAASEDRCWSVWDIAAERLTAVTACPMGAVRGVAQAPDQVRELQRSVRHAHMLTARL